MLNGSIVKGMGGLYTVRDENGREYVLRCKGKFRRLRMSPLVGDMVAFTPGEGEEHGWVEEILPRSSQLARPPAANVELVFIVLAPVPAPDLLLTDRLLIQSRRQNIQPALVVNKCDQDPAWYPRIKRQYQGAEAPIYPVSAITGEGVEELKAAMRGKLSCMAGQSGVGKSTLVNALIGLEMKTGDISRKIQRGKHTTRHAELMEKDGLRLLDTPGFSLLEMGENKDPVLLQEDYPEFEPYLGQCRFSPCYHLSEPGCRVLAAVKAGEIPRERVERYHLLLNEMKEKWRERYD